MGYSSEKNREIVHRVVWTLVSCVRPLCTEKLKSLIFLDVLKTPETRQEVHSFHAKRRLLAPPYDPYEETPIKGIAQEPCCLGTVLEEEARAAGRAAKEEAKALGKRLLKARTFISDHCPSGCHGL